MNFKELDVSFYADLFRSDPSSGGEFMIGRSPCETEEVRRILKVEYSLADTQKALMGMD